MRAFIAALLLIAAPIAALADQCLAPPALNNPRTCNVPVGGGTCSFAYDEDGIVKFPNAVVTGRVLVEGGHTVYVGPGEIKLASPTKVTMAFNKPDTVFVEGLKADANGYCDVFAIRNQREIQTKFTFQNVFAEGPAYNNPNVGDGKCHGDLIQNQGEDVNGGLSLTVENFQGVTNAQGLFIPHRAYGDASTVLRNVYIERETDKNWKPLLWLYAPWLDSKDREHPITLDNVWVDVNPGGTQVYPNDGTVSGGEMSFPSEPFINGVVSIGKAAVDYRQITGLSYDRAVFCGGEPTPDPAPGPVADATPPTVQIVSPPGVVLRKSNQLIIVEAEDDVALLRVEISIDGRLYEVLQGGGSIDWTVPANPHAHYDIEALAVDTSGNFAIHKITVFATK